jgi:hypothetical protein
MRRPSSARPSPLGSAATRSDDRGAAKSRSPARPPILKSAGGWSTVWRLPITFGHAQRAPSSSAGVQSKGVEPLAHRSLMQAHGWAIEGPSPARLQRRRRSDRLEPIDYLAQLCEDWAHSLGTAGGRCIVVLSLVGWGHDDLHRARELVSALNLAACSPRVCYVVLDGTAADVLPVLAEAPRRVATLRVAPDAAGMEAGLQAQLRGCPSIEEA